MSSEPSDMLRSRRQGSPLCHARREAKNLIINSVQIIVCAYIYSHDSCHAWQGATMLYEPFHSYTTDIYILSNQWQPSFQEI